MSIKYKLLSMALLIIIINAVTIGAWYKMFLSGPVADDYTVSQELLDTDTRDIASGMMSQTDIKVYIENEANEHELNLSLENADGEVLYSSLHSEETNIWIRSAVAVELEGEVYILRSSRVVTSVLAENDDAKTLIWAEICILIVILLSISSLIYVKYIKPLEALEKNIRNYKAGSRAEITDREDEIGRLQNSFVGLSEMIDDEKEKQSRIIASISHDIKTPLTSVMGYAERMKRGTLSEERTARYVDTIYKKAVAIRDLVNEFDDYISSNQRLHYSPSEVDVMELINSLREEYTDELSAAGVEFTAVCTCENVALTIDKNQMRRVFGNLIANAVKHMHGETRKINVLCEEVDDGQYEFVRISVSDTGKGVEESMLETIFEPLFTTDEGRSVAGLGLAICKEVIECHGGTIKAENNSDRGLTVLFTLPIKQPEETEDWI